MTHIIIDRTRVGRDVGLTTTASSLALMSLASLLLKAGPGPMVTSVTPLSLSTGDTLTINGSGFGSTRGTSTVSISNGAFSVPPSAYSSWSATTLRVTVPNLVPGSHTVTVTVGTTTSNSAVFSMDTNYYNVVTQGGLDNTGATSVTSGIGTCITAYKAGGYDGLYFPTGTYLLSTALTVPSNTTLVGQSMTGAWLSGRVNYNSTSSFSDLKIGPASAGAVGLINVSGASGTTFTRCHIRGGNTSTGSEASCMAITNSASYLTFDDCEVERTLFGGGTDFWNTISIYPTGTIEYVTFDGCNFGVSNGTATGASRMLIEVWTNHGLTNLWQHLTFTGCEFQASNNHTLDLACYGDSGQANDVLVENCTFHGSNNSGGRRWGYGICLEWPTNVIIRNNHFHRCSEAGIYSANFGQSYHTYWEITGNTFDWDTAEIGIGITRSIIALTSAYNTVTGNTFHSHSALGWPYGCVELNGESAATCHNNTVTGNTFNMTTGLDSSIVEVQGATGNTITPNTVNRS